MLAKAVESYLELRRAAGFALRCQGSLLRTFATFSNTKGKHNVCSETAIEWAGSVPSISQRARRLDEVIRFARYIRAEDPHHEIPPAVFGRQRRRPVPFIFSKDNIRRIVRRGRFRLLPDCLCFSLECDH
jgi:integrase/recombinase XerD